jgi:hypothetical protein
MFISDPGFWIPDPDFLPIPDPESRIQDPKGKNLAQFSKNYGKFYPTLFLVVKKYLSWFWKFQNAPLMRCRHCHFLRSLGEKILENYHSLEIYIY